MVKDARILIICSGDGAGISFARSLYLAGGFHTVGVDTSKEDLLTSDAHQRFLIEGATTPGFIDRVNGIVAASGVDLIYCADTGAELNAVFEARERLNAPTFLPDLDALDCEDKWLTYLKLADAGIHVPETILAVDADVVERFVGTGRHVWIRRRWGSGGAGSIATSDAEFAVHWIGSKGGWGDYTVADRLGTRNVTWTAVWQDGVLRMSQLRERVLWKYRHLAPSGVTGITGIQKTLWDRYLHDLALAVVAATVRRPHGVVSVDFTYDEDDRACPTEVQTSRFFTSIDFLATVGVNFPEMYCALGLGQPVPADPRINPVREELYWIRAVDRLPYVMSSDEYESAGV